MDCSERMPGKREDRAIGPDQDRILVERCLRQEAAAWETMVRSHGKKIFRLCYRYTGRRDEAEDLMQEVFLRVYLNLGTFNSGLGCFQSWILRVGRNIVIDHHRQTRHFQTVLELDEQNSTEIEDPGATSPYYATEQSENSSMVMDRLARFPAEVREAILLRELEGLSYDEISRRLGVSVGTIKSRVSRGRRKLANSIRRARTGKIRKPRRTRCVTPLVYDLT